MSKWQAYFARPHLRHWIALVDGIPAGLLSLDAPPPGAEFEIDTVGLLPAYVGRGIGGHLPDARCPAGLNLRSRRPAIWLHTSDRDHPQALPNYERRGFRRYHDEGADPSG